MRRRDTDSPVEWTGEAHLVSRTCKVCDNGFSQPETNAEYQSEHGIPPVCSDCRERIEDLWSDMYIRSQVDRLCLLAEYMEAHGYPSKKSQLRNVAQVLQQYEPVIRGIESAMDSGSLSNRAKLEEHIRKYEDN